MRTGWDPKDQSVGIWQPRNSQLLHITPSRPNQSEKNKIKLKLQLKLKIEYIDDEKYQSVAEDTFANLNVIDLHRTTCSQRKWNDQDIFA